MAMPDSREVILERIRSAIGATEQSRTHFRVAIPRDYTRAGALEPEACLHLFLDRLRDYDTNVVEASSAEVPQAIAAILQGHGQKKVIVADGLPQEILPADFGFLPEHEADVEDLNNCDGIITICTAGIATTGTIVLTHGPGEGARRLTLLPDRHLCVVRAEQVVETVPEAIDRLAPFATHPLTFISGPSATADIEMTRIRGVHGPRFLDVVLVR